MKPPKKYQKYLAWFAFAVAVICVYKFIDRIDSFFGLISTVMSVSSPFITGFLIAFILNSPTNFFDRHISKIKNKFISTRSRGLSVLAVYLIAIGAIGVLIGFVVPAASRSLIDLIGKLPGYLNSAMEFAKTHISKEIFDIEEALGGITVDKLLSFIDVSKLSTYAQGVFKVGSTVINIFIAAIVSVYMLLSKNSLLRIAKRMLYVFVPKNGADIVVSYTRLICDIFYKYIYSQCMDALIVGVSCVVAFSIIGVPYGALMGILVGASNLIPYFGAIVSGALTVLLTLISGEPVKAIIVLVLILVIQQIDSNILQPRIMSSNIGIKPLYILFAITVGGGLFGVAGMIIGVPVVATLKEIVNNFVDYVEKKKAEKAEIEEKSV